VNRARLVRAAVAGVVIGAAVVAAATLPMGGSGAARAAAALSGSPAGPLAQALVKSQSTFRGDLRRLPQLQPRARPARPEREAPETPVQAGGAAASVGAGEAPASISAAAPAPLSSFDGLHDLESCTGGSCGAGHPPDTNGDVGPTYYIQTINTAIGIYNKSTGARVAGLTFDNLMSQGNFGNLCDTDNYGDPVVLYDTFHDRWVITDFAFQLDGAGDVVDPPGSFQCFAVSRSGDPVGGGWNFYSLAVTDALQDYPKLGIWPDGLYMSANMFGFGATDPYENVRVWSLNLAQMEAGAASPQSVAFDLPAVSQGEFVFTALPSNARAQTGAPPAGAPNYFASVWGFGNRVRIWKFHVDWTNTANSTLTGPTDSTVATSWADPPDTVPAKSGNSLDTLGIRLMMQNQYTNIGGFESLWNVHTVRGSSASQAAVRYYQVKVTGGTVEANATQGATWNPDSSNRFMPSVAVDRAGDMALGYSVSSSTLFPAIRYAGRLAGDPVNTLSQTENSFIEGTGSQTGNCGGRCERWGDYSAMTLDPDGCTFWYTNEYYAASGLDHHTRIGSFKFASCTAKASQSITFSPLASKTFGDADFSVAATATSGLSVSLAASGNCTVAGSTVHITAAGSCTITASQAGDGTYNAAPDVARTFTIAKASQTIAFAALRDLTTVDPDFSVAATASSGLAVSFAGSGSCTVSGSTVHVTSVGSCTVTGSQPGDANYSAASAVARMFSITRASQTIAFGAPGTKTFGDADFAVSATASSGLAVTFAATGSCTLTGATVHIGRAGSCTVTASQAGDANYNAAADVPQTFAIDKANQTITFRALANKTFGGADFSVSGSASSALAVSFTARGSCTIRGSTVHLTGAGSCAVTASQPGNADFNAAISVARSFAITKAKCTVPRIIGKTLTAAKVALKQKHCSIGKVSRGYSRTTKKGRVSSQSRRAGQVLANGAKVSVVVSRGRRPSA
jgi:hypothetical protein